MSLQIQPLIAYFNRIHPLNTSEIEFVEKAFQMRKVKRGQFILQEGDVCKHNTFVVEGCFKMYLVDDNG